MIDARDRRVLASFCIIALAFMLAVVTVAFAFAVAWRVFAEVAGV